MCWVNVSECRHCKQEIDNSLFLGDNPICPNCNRPLVVSIKEVADKIKTNKNVRLRVRKSELESSGAKKPSGVLFVVHRPWRYAIIRLLSFFMTSALVLSISYLCWLIAYNVLSIGLVCLFPSFEYSYKLSHYLSLSIFLIPILILFYSLSGRYIKHIKLSVCETEHKNYHTIQEHPYGNISRCTKCDRRWY